MSLSRLCVQCWRVLSTTEIEARCATCTQQAEGPDLPGWARRPGSDRTNPIEYFAQRQLLGPTRYACDRHADIALELFCQHCKAKLDGSAEAGRNVPQAVGFAGHVAAGKTLYLLTAINRLNGASVQGQRISLLPIGDTARRFLALSEDLFCAGGKPQPNPPLEQEVANPAISRNLGWELYHGDRGEPPVCLLAMHDVGGETWSGRISDKSGLFERYLRLLSAVIFLIDGAAVAADLGLSVSDAWDPSPREGDRGAADLECFHNVEERLGDGAHQVSVALVLSKSDYLWDDRRWADLKLGEGGSPTEDQERMIERILHDSGRGALLAASRHKFSNTELFAVSSLGFRPQHGDVDAQRRLTRRPEPVGVTAPLVNLLELST